MTMTMTHTPIDIAALKAAYAKIGRHTVSPEIGAILDAAAELIKAVEERDAEIKQLRYAQLKIAELLEKTSAHLLENAKVMRESFGLEFVARVREYTSSHMRECASAVGFYERLASLQPEVAKREEGV